MVQGLTACVTTVGCRLNQADSDALRGYLHNQGVKLVNKDTVVPDIYFINTCAVTANAERSSLALVRTVCRLQPKPRVVVFGCLATRAPELVKSVPGVDEVWTGEEKNRRIDGHTPLSVRSRALLKVQDGCDRTCSYCIVRNLRGRPVSVPPELVHHQFEQLLDRGYQEIVLTGLNLACYESGGMHLAELIHQLLKKPGNFRLRLASIEPDLFTDELISLIAHPKICAHFHIPLQSGDDRILKQMSRPYRTVDYAHLLKKIKAVKPDAGLGCDVIVGFPEEDEASFNRTCQFLNTVPVTYLHVFPYSPRPGTPAFSYGDPVPKSVKIERVKRLRRWSEEQRRLYAQRFSGVVREAILEPDGHALTDNYLRVVCPNVPKSYRAGTLVKVALHLTGEKLLGSIIDEPYGMVAKN